MIPYLSVFGLFALLSLRDFQNQTRAIVIALSIFLIWFAGLRFYVGCDFQAYTLRYEQAVFSPWSKVLSDDEFGFGVLTAIFAKAGLPFSIFQAAVTTLIIGLYTKFALRHKDAIFVLALFFPILILQLGMSGMRQAVAVSLVLMAYNAYIDGKRIQIAIWIIFAFVFHNSAIILLPMAFIAGRDISLPRLVAGFVVLAPAAIFLLGGRIEVYSDRYIEQIYGSQESAGAGYRYIFTLIPVFVAISLRNRIKNRFPEVYQLILFGILFSLSISITAVISTVALHRLTFYAMPLSIIMALYTARVFPVDKVRVQIVWLGLFAAYIVSWFVTSRHANVCYQPYQNFTFSELLLPAWVP